MPDKKLKALVTGAAGAVGSVLVEELADRGWNVRAAVRKGSSSAFPAGVDVMEGDLLDRASVERAVEGADVIFHFAAKLHINDPSEDLRDEYEAVNVGVTRSLLECSEASRRSFLFASTINVYGNGGEYDDDSGTDPKGMYAETKAEAERLVIDANGTVLRFAAVYGPHMKGNFPRLIAALRKGMFVFVGGGQNRRTLVYETDAARAAILCAGQPESAGKTYNVSDGEIHSLREIVEAISKAIGKRPPRLHLSAAPVSAVLRFLDAAAGVFGKKTGFSGMLEKLNEDMAVRADRIRIELGFEPEVGLEEGWRRTVGSE